MQAEFAFEGFVTPQDVRRQRYLYLPFEVPPGTARISVSYEFSEPVTAPLGLGPGNTVDIGIFDPRGLDFPEAPGFRGWSGSARRQFFITPQEATPGYIAGPLLPGRWHIILGFERLLESGVSYRVMVSLEQGQGGTPVHDGENPGHSPRPRVRGGRFLRGDLHTHSVHSDGLNTVEELARDAIAKGLDFLAVTDHNTCTHHRDLERLAHLPIVLIPGEEVTTYWGHANAWGLRRFIDFRCTDEESLRTLQRFVREQGGLFSINHPKAIGPPWLFDVWDGFPCMEVWQAPWRFHNWDSLERWEALLQRGQRVVAVGGSDTHSIPPARPLHPHGIGNPTTWVYVPEAEAGEEEVLAAIRRGHVFVSADPEGPRLVLQADADGDGRYESLMGDVVPVADGRSLSVRVSVEGGAGRRLWLLRDGVPVAIVPIERDSHVFEMELSMDGHRYVRAELRGLRGRPERGEVVWALSNPIWCRPIE
ncbi:MAG: CehA/McbA family metallohydrolase [Dehalococcoidia bacterium]|nr:CehA/McbA family metallohydrolase [Dehalococcoidia bacterium]MDW8009374.1 CehA/McbA family metallohydrolase [Chloroflexota bacterium]